MRFADKVVCITGCAQGIGKSIAEAFAAEGASLALCDKDAAGVAALRDRLAATSPQATFRCYELDVRIEGDVAATVDRVFAEFGGIDILINNAGVSTMGDFWNLTEEEWDFNMDVNAKGVWLMCKHVAPHMIELRQGKIVNTASMAGKMGAALEAHYAASKFGVVGFTQAAAHELAPYGVNVNCVCPGFVKTGMQSREVEWEAKLRGISEESVVAGYIAQTPLGRLCLPEDVARVVTFLASSDADFMTGQAINVTGGACMH